MISEPLSSLLSFITYGGVAATLRVVSVTLYRHRKAQ